MPTWIAILIIILLLGGGLPAWNYAGPYAGGGVGLLVLILIILLLTGRL